MFKKIDLNAVKSSEGFEVSRVSRFELLYKEGDRIVKVEVEPGDGLAIYQKSLKEWLVPDGDTLLLTKTEVKRVLKNICHALDFLGTKYVLS